MRMAVPLKPGKTRPLITRRMGTYSQSLRIWNSSRRLIESKSWGCTTVKTRLGARVMGDKIFFGYPEHPTAQAEVMRASAGGLRGLGKDARTWQDLEVDGKVRIWGGLAGDRRLQHGSVRPYDSESQCSLRSRLCRRTRKTHLVCPRFHIEVASALLGRISDLERDRLHLVPQQPAPSTEFASQDPVQTLTAVDDDIIEPVLPENARERRSLFYCSTFEPFEASNRLSNFVDVLTRP